MTVGVPSLEKKGLSVIWVVLVIIAALLLAGLWYVRGRA
jgi:hypothetical protein